MVTAHAVANWNENNLNPLTMINWRASLVPAAAVIPAPVAYTNVAAVKKLVVGFLVSVRPSHGCKTASDGVRLPSLCSVTGRT